MPFCGWTRCTLIIGQSVNLLGRRNRKTDRRASLGSFWASTMRRNYCGSRGKMILSGSSDCSLQRWDIDSGKPIGEPFRRHLNYVTSEGFTEASRIIVSGCCVDLIRRWGKFPSRWINESTQRWEGPVTDIEFSNDGQKFVTSSSKGTLLQWNAKKTDKSETKERETWQCGSHCNKWQFFAVSPNYHCFKSCMSTWSVHKWIEDVKLEFSQAVRQQKTVHRSLWNCTELPIITFSTQSNGWNTCHTRRPDPPVYCIYDKMICHLCLSWPVVFFIWNSY